MFKKYTIKFKFNRGEYIEEHDCWGIVWGNNEDEIISTIKEEYSDVPISSIEIEDIQKKAEKKIFEIEDWITY